MDYRDLINEAQELMDEAPNRGRKNSGKKANQNRVNKKKRTPEQVAASKKQSEDAKAANKANATMGKQAPSTPKEKEADKLPQEKEVDAKIKKIAVGSKETQEKYKVNYAQPLEAAILALRSVYDVGTLPGNLTSDAFFDKISTNLENKESANERWMKKQAKIWYKAYDENLGNDQAKLNVVMTKISKHANENSFRKFKVNLKGEEIDSENLKLLIKPGGVINFLYDTLVKSWTYDSYETAVRTAATRAGTPSPEEYILACIYNRLYYIYIMLRFSTAVGNSELMPAADQGIKWVNLKGMTNSEKGVSTTTGSSGGTAANVQNTLNQAMTQLLSIDTSDITVMESYIDTVNSANKFISEDLGNIDQDALTRGIGGIGKGIGKALGGIGNAAKDVTVSSVKTGMSGAKKAVNNIKQTGKDAVDNNNPRTLRVMNAVPLRFKLKANANKEEITKYPQVLVDFIILMSLLIKRKAFTADAFNVLIKAKEIEKIDRMEEWLGKNKGIMSSNKYVQKAMEYMVDAKESADAGTSGIDKFAARNPNATKLGKGALGTAKLVGKGLKGLGKLF